MARSALTVRDAVPEDVPALLHLWSCTSFAPASPRPAEEARAALAQIAADPDERLLVGTLDDDNVVAAMHLRRAPVSPLHLENTVHTSYLIVAPDQRKHGFAHALLEAAVAWAEEKDVAQVSVITSADRETNRFYARLGLSEAASLRFAPTAALRHRLVPGVRRHPSRRNLGRILAERRAARHLHHHDPDAPEGPAPDDDGAAGDVGGDVGGTD